MFYLDQNIVQKFSPVIHYDFMWILLATHLHNIPHNNPTFFGSENGRSMFLRKLWHPPIYLNLVTAQNNVTWMYIAIKASYYVGLSVFKILQ